MTNPNSIKSRNSRAQVLFDKHYEWHSRYSGDENPKNAAAHAKRVSTGLKKAIAEFAALLEPKQLQALQDASGVMAALGADLDVVCKMARANNEAQAAKDLLERNALADEVAAERWRGDDQLMLLEAKDLAAFVDQARALDVDEWIATRHPGAKYAQFPMEVAGRARLVDVISRDKGKVPDMLLVRRRAAEYVHMLRLQGASSTRRYQDMWYVGLDDYESWRAWRKEISSAVVPALKQPD